MRCLRRCALMFPLSAAISFLAVSCAPTKSSQCSQIIQIANEAGSEASKLTDAGENKNRSALLQAADTMEQAAQDMKALETQDKQLQEYQAGFIRMYRAYSQATREMLKARKDHSLSAAKVAREEVQQAGRLEKQLVTGINNYCHQS